MPKLNIGVIKEGKTPADTRVPLIPAHCKRLAKQGIHVKVQSSNIRAYSDKEYHDLGIETHEDVSSADILFGVKEVRIQDLIPNKTYFFFSHTIKAQPYNRNLLRACIEKNIRLIDYEPLVFKNKKRVVAFGEYAGMVGAHNALLTYGKRTGKYSLKPAHQCSGYEEMVAQYKGIQFEGFKTLVSGRGRVAKGAIKVLEAAGIKKVRIKEYIGENFEEAVFIQVGVKEYVRRINGKSFLQAEFFKSPNQFKSHFMRFVPHTDIFINAIYWDPLAPVFFTRKQMRNPEFKIQVIADVTCDIEGSIPSTLRPSTIEDPVYGYDPVKKKEVPPYGEGVVDVMAVDNLPNELPRDASLSFGNMILKYVIPQLKKPNSAMLNRATICRNGKLGKYYGYLQDYVA